MRPPSASPVVKPKATPKPKANAAKGRIVMDFGLAPGEGDEEE